MAVADRIDLAVGVVAVDLDGVTRHREPLQGSRLDCDSELAVDQRRVREATVPESSFMIVNVD